MAPPPARPRSAAVAGGKRSWWSRLRGPRGTNRRLRAARPITAARPSPSGPPGSPPASAPGDRGRLGRFLAVALPVLAMGVGGVGIGAGLVMAHRFVTTSPHFQVREVRVSGVRHLQPEEVRARAGLALGDNLFSVPLDEVRRRLRAEPWIASARIHRELPSALVIDVVEREAAAAVVLGALYLVDPAGEVWKRATVDEAAALPVATGLARDAYVHDREAAQALLREGLAALAAWRAGPARAAIGEVHVDPAAGTTLYTREGGVALHVGRGDGPTLAGRLVRVDAVLGALEAAGERPQIIHAEAALHPERIAVRLAGPRRPAAAPEAPRAPAGSPAAADGPRPPALDDQVLAAPEPAAAPPGAGQVKN